MFCAQFFYISWFSYFFPKYWNANRLVSRGAGVILRDTWYTICTMNDIRHYSTW